MAWSLEALAQRYRQGLHFCGFPTSEQNCGPGNALGILLTSFMPHRQIDLTIDGADEVDRGTLNPIKELGGALLHEKIVASNSRRLAIVVDEAKLVDRLGRRLRYPSRSSPLAWRQHNKDRGAWSRHSSPVEGAGEPFVTDSRNRILDCNFGPITNPAQPRRGQTGSRGRRVRLFISWAGPFRRGTVTRRWVVS